MKPIIIRNFLWLPFHWDGLACKPFIFLRKRASDSSSLLAHEMVHIRQQERHGLLKYLYKYFTNETFRLKMEFEAYYMGSGMDSPEAREYASRYTSLLWWE
jgi:hypothetical protein